MRDATIGFDLDGTLVDTAPDLIGATNHVLAAAGLPPVAVEDVRPWIGYGAQRMITECLALAGRPGSPEEVNRLLEKFLIYYAENIARLSRPFDGVTAAMDACAERGARFAVCTNKREALAVALLKALDLDGRFAFIAGRDTFPVSKPHPDHLLNTIMLADGDPKEAVMIGDSSVDIATAKAAHVPIVAVTFGYSERPVAEFAPDATIDDFGQMVGAVEALLARGRETAAVAESSPRGAGPP